MTSAAGFPLRAALSVPAIVALVVQQAGRLGSMPSLLWWVLFEAGFVAAAFSVARRAPEASWAWVPVLWSGAALGAVVDALLLGGRVDAVLPMAGFAALPLIAGFALARALPSRKDGGGAQTAPPHDPDPGQ
jgi:hypothetical protein